MVVSDLDDKGGAETVAQIRSGGGSAVFIRADISLPQENERLVHDAVREFGALHIAVNNAGIAGPSAPVGEYPTDGWDRVISVNLSGVFYGMRYQIPAMLAAGGGSIVNVGSILSQVGFRNAAAYASAKHALVGLTQTAALEYGRKNIRVNAVGPGFIRTPLISNVTSDEDALRRIEGLHALGRLGEPSEVAALVLWLNGDTASFVTGGYYAIDGGYLAQ